MTATDPVTAPPSGPLRPSYVYVASSWRNHLQPAVIATLRAAGIDCYDFRNPDVGTGFAWSQVGLQGPRCRCDHSWTHGMCRSHGEPRQRNPQQPDALQCNCPKDITEPVTDYLAALDHPRAVEGYVSDFDAMQRADTFVLVLPCGRSAHLELGWAVGAGKRTAILLEDPCTPELMYRMVDHLTPSLVDLLGWLGVQD
jgi:hypothetical protein